MQPEKSTPLHFIYKSWIICLLTSWVWYSCRPKDSLTEEYRELAKVTEKMKGSTFWIVDSSRSFIRFQASQSSAFVVSGKIPVNKGSLLVDKQSILAGFFDCPLSGCRVEEYPKNLDLDAELKMLRDSLPVLFSAPGNRIRVDMMQGGKQSIRTGYRESPAPGSDTSVTHLFQVKWEFADSVLTFSLPASLSIKKKTIDFKSSAGIGYPDYGIAYRRRPGGESPVWMPMISCRVELVFKPFKP